MEGPGASQTAMPYRIDYALVVYLFWDGNRTSFMWQNMIRSVGFSLFYFHSESVFALGFVVGRHWAPLVCKMCDLQSIFLVVWRYIGV